MKKLATLLFAFGLVLTAVETRADVLLLAHGYLSHASTWEASGVARILERDRWKRTGILITAPMGRIRVIPATSTPRANPNPNHQPWALQNCAPVLYCLAYCRSLILCCCLLV